MDDNSWSDLLVVSRTTVAVGSVSLRFYEVAVLITQTAAGFFKGRGGGIVQDLKSHLRSLSMRGTELCLT